MKSVSILGSTGSVGTSTLDVIAANPGQYRIKSLTAGNNVELLACQAKQVGAERAVIADEELYSQLKDLLAGTHIEVAAGRQAVLDAAADGADWTMAAIVGMAGLEPIMAALRSGKQVAVANKEPLVSAGPLVMQTARQHGAIILPVDSEHNAIFQAMETSNKKSIRRLILTASGGPFRETPLEELEFVTTEQALKHPNWVMGRKISIDSATMMNKALEVIEARYLFDMEPDRIDVVIHPQSVIHSMVEYSDGSILAQMGPSDMKVPIAHCLGWPNRIRNDFQPFDFTKFSALTFEPLDSRRFPAINYAYDCLEQGGAACLAMNAANEIAVDAFLNGQIGYLSIFETVKDVVEASGSPKLDDLQSILDYDQQVRAVAKQRILEITQSNRKVS